MRSECAPAIEHICDVCVRSFFCLTRPKINNTRGKTPPTVLPIRVCRPFAPNQTKVDKPYWNSENDLVDGIMPQWGGTLTPGMSWPKTFLLNYIVANGSATMLCPFIHGWNQNLGRHNHGCVRQNMY